MRQPTYSVQFYKVALQIYLNFLMTTAQKPEHFTYWISSLLFAVSADWFVHFVL